VSILVPSLRRAQDLAKDAKCRVNFHNIGLLMHIFAADHNGTLPGVAWAHTAEAWTYPWIGSEVIDPIWYLKNPFSNLFPTTRGTLLGYMGGVSAAKRIYRCPGLAAGTYNSAVGSNGMFDVCGVLLFAGAKVERIPVNSNVRDPIDASNMWKSVVPPIAVEEAEYAYNNNLWTLPTWNSGDQVGTWHPNFGSNYAAVDGSVGHLTFRTRQGAAGERDTQGDWLVTTPLGLVSDFRRRPAGEGEWGWFNSH